MEKVAFISNVCYRATMYQYVYPTMGLMTECQYDICKRDFSLDIVEGWAKENDGPYFCGANPSLADLYWVNLWLGNNWVMNDDFELPWKHKDVIDKYPASKKIIDGMLEIPAVKTVCDQSLGEGDAGVTTVNATGLFFVSRNVSACRPATAIQPASVPRRGNRDVTTWRPCD